MQNLQSGSDSDCEEITNCTPPEISEAANAAKLSLLPKKSAKIYENQYKLFLQWCTVNSVKNTSENVLLAYFSEKAKQFKSSSLWGIYSMLKATLIAKRNVDISKYVKLIAFLKRTREGYKAKNRKY